MTLTEASPGLETTRSAGEVARAGRSLPEVVHDSPAGDLSTSDGLNGPHWQEHLLGLRMSAQETSSLDATERQHAKGKLTARERIELLLDPGTFTELQMFARHSSTGFGLEDNRPFTDGVVTGWGHIEGRPVAVYASDFRLFGGALGATYARKVHQLLDLAAKAGTPVIALNDGAGARIQEGVAALDGYGGIFRRNAALSGVVPQISVVLGPCAGGAVYSPALTDFVFMVDRIASMYITGPEVIRAVTGEDVTHEQLGGAAVHATRSGVAAGVYPDEESCLADVRFLVGLLPSNNGEAPPDVGCDDRSSLRPRLRDVVPRSPKASYDVHDIMTELVDDAELFEISPGFARNIVCALGRVDGSTVGLVANQPAHLAGALDIDASEKAARFVRFCDSFNIPVLTLVDVPGFLPGTGQEHAGIIRRGAKLLYAYCEATVPRICVIMRKSYGGAYIVMDSKSIGADVVLAWPGNEVAVMGVEGAANIIFRKQISASPTPETTRSQLVDKYRSEMMGPLVSAEQGFVDDIIDPAETRQAIISNLRLLRGKKQAPPARKHANMPL